MILIYESQLAIVFNYMKKMRVRDVYETNDEAYGKQFWTRIERSYDRLYNAFSDTQRKS